jgi:PBSX family phage terminase large subunit
MRLSDIVTPAFYNFWRAYDEHLHIVGKGGRNSGKSTHKALKIIVEVMKHPINALIIRKVENTMELSVFAQLLWAVNKLGVSEQWTGTKKPLRLTYTPTGQQIIFRGADNPTKIQSIKSEKFPIAIMWIEELMEFRTEDEVLVILNSLLREELPDGLKYHALYSYNPPKQKSHWLNKKYNTAVTADNTYIHHSTYLDNPYCSKQMIEEAERVKESSIQKYNWIYMGEPVGSGIVPFTNLEFREITDDEIKSFDNIKQGLDWGYAADPLAFGRWHYDKTRRILYAIDEIYQIKLSNRKVSDMLKAKGYDRDLTIADSAEPKSIAEMKTYNINIKGAKKGQGSVEFGEKWLDDLEAIVIDPNRTSHIAQEFESADYEVDRMGNTLNRLRDKDNHHIDGCRYALEGEMTMQKWGW